MGGLGVVEVVDGVERAAVEATDELLRATGSVQPPMVHVLCAAAPSPYVGYLTSRPFRRGEDAAAAVRLMGVLPSLLGATHLVLTWEYADLCTALELPGESFPTGVVVLEASLSGHTVRWHPFRMHVGPVTGDGMPTVLPQWGEPARHPGVQLPAPVEELLGCWRRRVWRDEDIDRAVETLEHAGYRMRWAVGS